jgi:hypothetical protein
MFRATHLARFTTIVTCSLTLGNFGCSGDSGSNGNPGATGGNAGTGVGPSVAGTLNLPVGGGGINLGLGGSVNAAGSGGVGGGDCGSVQAGVTVTKQPVDIILIIDNSGSMEDEIVGVENNINQNFAGILGGADIDYRVILIARHGEASSNQSICIEAPLSGLASCDPVPEAPVFGERFFQYNMKIDSNDTFDKVLGAYEPPYSTQYEDKSDVSLMGWHIYLREGARKVFVEITDDDPEGMTWQAFDTALLAKSPAQFGTAAARNYIWHSIVGLDEKPTPTEAYLPADPLVSEMCGVAQDGELPVVTPGLPYQELSKLTGGLRFPICEWASYDAVFQRIATDVISRSEVACDFDIPPPPQGKELDLNKVAVAYTPGDGSAAQTYRQAQSSALCEPGAFYIENNRIYLCPDACAAVKADPAAGVGVLFTCESTIIDPSERVDGHLPLVPYEPKSAELRASC